MSRSVPRAPTRDGAVVADPPLAAVADLLRHNRARLARPDDTLLGQSLVELQARARREVIAAARDHLRQRGEPIPEGVATGLLVAGHQPELFHPGVWVKNFALNGLARRHGLTPLNLIVDNDTVKATSIRLPVPGHPPHLASVAFDRGSAETPYEEHRLAAPDLFATFGARAARELAPWGYVPLLTRFWPEVCRPPPEQWSLVERIPAARRALERAWGCHNLEVPMSAVCRTASFGWFAAHLLSELPRFHALYNGAVQAYRRRQGIKSRNHPVPDLAKDGEWLEAPFWGWRVGQGRRGRLFARRVADRITLRAGGDDWPLAITANGAGANGAGALGELEAAGCKLRPRALTTTLFARLLLADLFLHGIGGGKYDELTDTLLRGFYAIEPPDYLILSGTCQLPLPAALVSIDDRQRLSRLARDLWWNPERHLLPGDRRSLDESIREKAEWVNLAPADAALRFTRIRQLSERLRRPLIARHAALRAELADTERQLAVNAILQRRDFAFCLYPAEKLRPFCEQFL